MSKEVSVLIEIYSSDTDDLVKTIEYDFQKYFLLLRDIAIGYNTENDYLMINPHRVDMNRIRMIHSVLNIDSKYLDCTKYEIFLTCSQ